MLSSPIAGCPSRHKPGFSITNAQYFMCWWPVLTPECLPHRAKRWLPDSPDVLTAFPAGSSIWLASPCKIIQRAMPSTTSSAFIDRSGYGSCKRPRVGLGECYGWGKRTQVVAYICYVRNKSPYWLATMHRQRGTLAFDAAITQLRQRLLHARVVKQSQCKSMLQPVGTSRQASRT